MRPYDIFRVLRDIAAAITGFIGWFLGGMDSLLVALTVFIVLDYITGVMCAIVEKRLSSEVGFRGILRKVLIFFIVGIAHIVDQYIIGSGSAIRSMICLFYISNEGISIIEKAGRIGLPIPEKLKDVLEQLKDKDEEEAA